MGPFCYLQSPRNSVPSLTCGLQGLLRGVSSQLTREESQGHVTERGDEVGRPVDLTPHWGPQSNSYLQTQAAQTAKRPEHESS